MSKVYKKSSKNNPRSIYYEERKYIERFECNGKTYSLIKSGAYYYRDKKEDYFFDN